MGVGASREAYIKAIETIQQQSVAEEDPLWQVLLSQSLDEDVIVSVIRSVRENQPDNLSILVRKLVEYLALVKGEQRGKNLPADFQKTNIALNYLCRIIPFILDYNSDIEDFSDRIFWQNKIVPSSRSSNYQPPTLPASITADLSTTDQSSSSSSLPQTKLDEKHLIPEQQTEQPAQQQASQQDAEKTEESKPLQPLERHDKTQPSLSKQVDSTPLAIKLMESLLDLLFHPGYTLDAAAFQPATSSLRELSPEQLSTSFAWQNGFGVESVKSGAAKAYWLNRMAVLQVLLACISEQLFTNQEHSYNYKSKWLDWITSTQDYYTETLLYSLINTFCTYDPVGWGVPYNHIMFADDQEPVAKLSIQILNVLISYDPPKPGTSPASSPNLHETPNKFINLLKSLKRTRDFQFFFTHFDRILGLPLMASHTRLPHSTKKIELHQDLLITFWRLISMNHDFLNFVTTNPSSPEFLVSLLQYMDEGRRSQTTHGLVQIGTFILLVLSGERDFAISLNKHFNKNIVIDIPKPTGYSDFIIIVMYRLLMDNNDKLESIFECILTVLSNLSPYMKNLSMVTCVKLMKLFEYLSSPRFLFANNHNHRYVHLLLETFNNLLQHQYESNTRLLYAILRCQNQFSKLAYLKISTSIKNPPPFEHPPQLNENEDQQQSTTTTTTTNASNDISKSIEEMNISGSTNVSTPHQNEPTKESQKSSTEHIHREEPPPLDSDKEKSTTTTTTTTTTNTLSSSSEQTQPPIDPKNAWIPTDEWLQSVKKNLPIENILKVITNLSPQIQRLCTGSGSDEQKIMEYLKISTTVGLFPVAGPIMTRKYHANPITRSWFIAYMWCIIYLENHSPPIFQHTNIKLFQVKH